MGGLCLFCGTFLKVTLTPRYGVSCPVEPGLSSLPVIKPERTKVRANKDKQAVTITDDDFQSGGLKQTSNVRPNRLFTMDNRIIFYRAGILQKRTLNKVIEKLIEIIRG